MAVGACVAGDPWEDEEAHAHAPDGRRSRFTGWICFRAESYLKRRKVHELAHLLAETDGHHDAVFRRTRRAVSKQYRRRKGGATEPGHRT